MRDLERGRVGVCIKIPLCCNRFRRLSYRHGIVRLQMLVAIPVLHYTSIIQKSDTEESQRGSTLRCCSNILIIKTIPRISNSKHAINPLTTSKRVHTYGTFPWYKILYAPFLQAKCPAPNSQPVNPSQTHNKLEATDVAYASCRPDSTFPLHPSNAVLNLQDIIALLES